MKQLFTATWVAIIWLCISMNINIAQENRPYRSFATQKYQQQLHQQNSNLSNEQAAIERRITHTSLNNEERMIIPIVFHVLSNVTNIEQAVTATQILSQVEALNESFNITVPIIGHPADTLESFVDHQITNLNIEFCLAAVESGQPTGSGSSAADINFVLTNVNEWTIDDAIKNSQLGGASPRNPDQYLNIWVGDLADNIGAYSTMPGSPSQVDGIVIDKKYFGAIPTTLGGTALSPYDEGKTLVHAIGSYLGLYELWSQHYPCGDDKLRQTPVHNAPNYGCARYQHVSACYDNPIELTMNYMDASDDACMYMFTQDQSQRMRAVLKTVRKNLVKDTQFRCGILDVEAPRIENRTDNNLLQNISSNPLELKAYPNPATASVTLDIQTLGQEQTYLIIYNTNGQLVHYQELSPNNTLKHINIPTSYWQPGIYFIHAKNDLGSAVMRLSIITP